MITTPETALFARSGLGDQFAPLRAQYPRSVWPDHRNLGATARFWLQRHDGFRSLGVRLRHAAAAYREAPQDAAALRGTSFRLLASYLGELDGHHHVEDAHYFPLFRAADPRLGRGFDVLDADHETLHGLILAIADAARSFDAALRGTSDPRPTADALAAAIDRMTDGVGRHLVDEEDIVVPLILDRTEPALGIG